jgi:single-strand DNA-binding protein
MASLNKIMIIGNAGADPVMRYLPSGSPVTNFNVAVNRKYKTRDGEQKEETDWFRINCFDRLAETANQYVTKGKQVYVEGRLQTRTWEDNAGEKRFSLEIHAFDLVLLGQRPEGLDDDQAAGTRSGADAGDLDAMPF